jgi:hypothetical protein
MTVNFRLWENGVVIQALNPAAESSSEGRTSAYVSLTNATKAYFVCSVTQGSATPVAWSVLQAKDDSGTSSTAVSAMPIAANEAIGTSDQFTFPANAASYTNTSTEADKIVIFEIDPAQCMNVNGGFTHVAVATAESATANVTSALLVLMPIKDQALNPPTTTSV